MADAEEVLVLGECLQGQLIPITGEIIASPLPELTIAADMRYESRRYSDDLNTLPLPGATTLDARVTWRFAPQAGVYLAVDNISNANIATSEGADHVYTYDEPRVFRAGITLAIP